MPHEKLEQIALRMRNESAGGAKFTPERMTARDFVGLYGWHRRTRALVSLIRNELEQLKLRTVPDFENTYIDTVISIEPEADIGDSDVKLGGADDPTVRVGALPEANNRPLCVSPNKPLNVATTLMQLNGLSRLPVMEGDFVVKGMISWQSIGNRRALGYDCVEVRDCMEPAWEIMSVVPLLDAMRDIADHGYVLVRGKDNRITGIVTASDIAHHFMHRAGPFLVIGEIEGYLRELVRKKFTVEEMTASRAQEDGWVIAGAADLTLGDYCKLLEDRKRWARLDVTADRGSFVERLDRVRQIRNDVMHFSLEDDDPKDMKTLSDFARFLRSLLSMNTG